MNYFISLTCPENKVASRHCRRISPSPGAAFVHTHPNDRTLLLQVWVVLIIVKVSNNQLRWSLLFCLAKSIIILYVLQLVSMSVNIASCNATVHSNNDLRVNRASNLRVIGLFALSLPFKMDCNFRCISFDNFLFIFTFYVKLAIAKLVRDIKNGGKPLSLFCVYILPLISIDGSDKLFYSTC